MTGCNFTDPLEPLFKKLNLLSFDDIFKLQYASLMYDQDHGNLPSSFSKYFRQVKDIHSHNTRMVSSNKLSENVKFHTKTHGKAMFKFKGPRILNEIKDLKFYGESKNKYYFRRKYKLYLLDK